MLKTDMYRLTKDLISRLDYLQTLFDDKTRDINHSEPYFRFVKEDSQEVFKTLNQWEKLVLDAIDSGSISIPQQLIESTIDNMNAFIMHSYYQDIRRRKYIEMKKSCLYVFHLVLRSNENGPNSN